jgi:hypothetical protein
MMRRAVDAINADDIPRDMVAPDCEITNAMTAVTDARYFGHEGATTFRCVSTSRLIWNCATAR